MKSWFKKLELVFPTGQVLARVGLSFSSSLSVGVFYFFLATNKHAEYFKQFYFRKLPKEEYIIVS